MVTYLGCGRANLEGSREPSIKCITRCAWDKGNLVHLTAVGDEDLAIARCTELNLDSSSDMNVQSAAFGHVAT